jgi:DNA-binding transcriptional LysR family regulator
MSKAMHVHDRIGSRMKLHDLHVLMTVVQAGSMGKAAAALNTGQPAISRSIADLEHALGVRLLDRNRQGVKPTEFGRALLDGGTVVFDELRQTMRNIAFLADPSVGEVRVGCNPFLAASFVSAAVDRISRRYPRVKFHLLTGYVETLHRALTERNVDLLIARRSGPIVDDRFDYEFLFDESYSVVAGGQSPWARRRRIELAELASEPWVLPPQDTTLGTVVLEAFRAHGLDYPNAIVISEPADVRISLVTSGRFISVFTNSLLKLSARRPELKVLRVRHLMGLVPVGIVTLKNRTTSPLARQFIESSREVAMQLAQGRKGGRAEMSANVTK